AAVALDIVGTRTVGVSGDDRVVDGRVGAARIEAATVTSRGRVACDRAVDDGEGAIEHVDGPTAAPPKGRVARDRRIENGDRSAQSAQRAAFGGRVARHGAVLNGGGRGGTEDATTLVTGRVAGDGGVLHDERSAGLENTAAVIGRVAGDGAV